MIVNPPIFTIIIILLAQPKRRHAAKDNRTPHRHRLVRMLPRVLYQEPKRERGAVRKSENAVEGDFGVDDVREECIRFSHGFFVAVIAVSSRPVVVAVVGPLVDVFDAWTGAAVDLTVEVDEGCAVVFF